MKEVKVEWNNEMSKKEQQKEKSKTERENDIARGNEKECYNECKK